MLTTSRHGTRRAHPVMFDRASVRLSLSEIVAVCGKPRRFSLSLTHDENHASFPVRLDELAALSEMVKQMLDAPTIDYVPSTDLRLGDVLSEVWLPERMVDHIERPAFNRIAYTSRTATGETFTTVARMSDWITVRLPRPPAEENTP